MIRVEPFDLVACEAGGVVTSNSRSRKCCSFRTTPYVANVSWAVSVHTFISSVGYAAELSTNSYLGCQPDNSHPYFIFHQRFNCPVDVSGIGGDQGSKYDDYFSSTVCRNMKQRSPSHLKGILKGWIAYRFLFPLSLDSCNGVVWITSS
jgi:hypothetical protein